MRLDWLDDGTGRLTWWDLHVIVKNAPVDSALTRAMFPELNTLPIELARMTEYTSRVAVWDSKANGDPELIPLPWDPKPVREFDVLEWGDVADMPGMERYAGMFT